MIYQEIKNKKITKKLDLQLSNRSCGERPNRSTSTTYSATTQQMKMLMTLLGHKP